MSKDTQAKKDFERGNNELQKSPSMTIGNTRILNYCQLTWLKSGIKQLTGLTM